MTSCWNEGRTKAFTKKVYWECSLLTEMLYLKAAALLIFQTSPFTRQPQPILGKYLSQNHMAKYWGFRNVSSSLCFCPLDFPMQNSGKESGQIMHIAPEGYTLVGGGGGCEQSLKSENLLALGWTRVTVNPGDALPVATPLRQKSGHVCLPGDNSQSDHVTWESGPSWEIWVLVVLGNIHPFRVSWNLPRIDGLFYMASVLLYICHLAWMLFYPGVFGHSSLVLGFINYHI